MLLPFIYFIHQPHLLIKSSSFPTRSPLLGKIIIIIILPNVCTPRGGGRILKLCHASLNSFLCKPLLVFSRSLCCGLLAADGGNWKQTSRRPRQTMARQRNPQQSQHHRQKEAHVEEPSMNGIKFQSNSTRLGFKTEDHLHHFTVCSSPPL